MTITTVQSIAWLLGLAVPLATDLVTKSAAPRAVKATVAAVFAALAGVLPTIVITATTRWQDYVWSVLGAWAVALATHATGVSDGVQSATARFGIGPSKKTPAPFTPHEITPLPDPPHPPSTPPQMSSMAATPPAAVLDPTKASDAPPIPTE